MRLLTEEIKRQLPRLYTTEETPLAEKLIVAKGFHPASVWTWYPVEGEEQEGGDWLFFGYVEGHVGEWGYFALSELAEAHVGARGLTALEQDLLTAAEYCGASLPGKPPLDEEV